MSFLARNRASQTKLRAFARHLYRERRIRDGVLGENLFGEANWDILLDLYASEEEKRPVTVSSACFGATVPPSTASRYLRAMEEQNLVIRVPSPSDRRAHYVKLSEPARVHMTELLRRLMSEREKLP
jgi:DNA-binding MarR family transcriptional regulator